MKPYTLPVKRKPVSKGILRRLSAVTRPRRQRVAATAMPEDFEDGDSSSKISRALTIIFVIHVVVIGLIFFHQQYLDKDRPGAEAGKGNPLASWLPSTAAPAAEAGRPLPKLSNGDSIYRVVPGDNYGKIAIAQDVEEQDLRDANNNVDITPGRVLKIPPKRIVAVEPPEVAAIIANTPVDRDRGLVEAIPVEGAPKARLVRPAVPLPGGHEPAVKPVAAAAPARPVPVAKPVEAAPPATASGRTYVVKPGDSVYRIASRFAVDQKALMKLNGISDPKKLKLGMTLKIPR